MRLWLDNNKLYHPLSVPVLLVAVILAVYFPALYGGIHPIDDPGIISFYSTSPPLLSIILPGNGYYYRPLLELLFWLDNFLWAMEPRTMHLENILLHCANSVLVFLLVRKLLGGTEKPFRLLTLLVVLLFALHPVNVEAVAWIAGRSDLLLTLFVLSACYFGISWLDKQRWQDMVAALMLFSAALLTKETALAFGAVAILMILVWPGTATMQQRKAAVGILMIPGILLMVLALFFRSGTSALSRLISGIDSHAAQGIYEAVIAFGFYIRKLLVPVPLNFAILEVHPNNALIGFVLVPILIWMFCRNRQAALLLTFAVLLILPAVVVAVRQIAWTSFAERYLYLPSAFLALGLAVLSQSCRKQYRQPITFFALLVIAGYATISIQRTMLWSDKLAFFQDAVIKSPKFGSVYHSLGGILMQNGDIDQASEMYANAERLNKRDSMQYPIKAGIMGTMLAKGEYLEAKKYFYQLFKEKRAAPADFLELIYLAESKQINSLSGNAKALLAADLLETLDLLNQKSYDPFWLYRSGQISLVIGDKVKAVDFFQRSYASASADAHYREAALIYLRKLEIAQ